MSTNSDAGDGDDSSSASTNGQRRHPMSSAAATRGRAIATMMATQNGQSPPDIDEETARTIGQFANSTVSGAGGDPYGAGSRRLPMGVGQSHDGDRDIWQTLGYPDVGTVGADQYLERYERQDLARAIISIPVETTWKEYPTITDDSSPDEESEFEEALDTLQHGNALRQNLLHYFEWADRLQRIGEYGLLFLGVDDGRSLDQKVNEDALEGPEDLTYIQPFSQASVADWELAEPGDGTDRQPGLPLTYDIEFEQPGAEDDSSETETRTVHYSRVVHIVEQPEQSVLKHTPVLEPILNRLIDHEKVVGAAAEMFWSSADRKFFAKAEGGGGFSPEDVEQFDQQMWEMVNGMRTTAAGENIDLEVIDGQAVDPSGVIEAIIKSIVSTVGIPMRKLLGSERGELASSMDQATWFGKIEERQQQFATPVLIKSTLYRLINFGILPPPQGGSFDVEWPDLYELTAEDESQIQKNSAQAVQAVENAIALGAPRDLLYEDILEVDPRRLKQPTGGPEDEDTFPPEVTGEPEGDMGDRGPEQPRPEATGEGATGGVSGGATLPENDTAVAADGGLTAQSAPSTNDLAEWAPNAQYDEGDVVASPNGRGVVFGVITSDLEFPQGTDDTTEIEASNNSPAFIVALEQGGSAPYRASALRSSSFEADDPSTDGEALANIVNEDVDVSLPPDWDRQSLLKWWSSVGGTWEDARDAIEEADEISGEPERMASAMKDAVASTRRWRNRF